MRISDWSSDVCSSDLRTDAVKKGREAIRGPFSLHRTVRLGSRGKTSHDRGRWITGRPPGVAVPTATGSYRHDDRNASSDPWGPHRDPAPRPGPPRPDRRPAGTARLPTSRPPPPPSPPQPPTTHHP